MALFEAPILLQHPIETFRTMACSVFRMPRSETVRTFAYQFTVMISETLAQLHIKLQPRFPNLDKIRDDHIKIRYLIVQQMKDGQMAVRSQTDFLQAT